jgi:serine/threonine-protein kinase
MDLASAIEAIAGAGLQPIVEYTPSQTIPAGQIIPGSQSPAAGTLVTPGTPNAQVFFQVSAGPAESLGQVTVPNLVGLSVLAARASLRTSFLSAGMIAWAVSNSPEGTVTAQSVTAGSSVSAATIVNVTVSAGPQAPSDQVNVPAVS